MVEIRNMISKIKSMISKYKYVVPIIAVGVVLLLWPSGDKTETDDTSIVHKKSDNEQEVAETEKRLSKILSMVSGVGRVEVFLALEHDSKVTYASNVNVSADERNDGNLTGNSNKSSQTNIVTVRDENGNETALVTARSAVKYRGALVVCDGGDIASVRLKITQAVSNLLSLSTDAISVMKMSQ